MSLLGTLKVNVEGLNDKQIIEKVDIINGEVRVKIRTKSILEYTLNEFIEKELDSESANCDQCKRNVILILCNRLDNLDDDEFCCECHAKNPENPTG